MFFPEILILLVTGTTAFPTKCSNNQFVSGQKIVDQLNYLHQQKNAYPIPQRELVPPYLNSQYSNPQNHELLQQQIGYNYYQPLYYGQVFNDQNSINQAGYWPQQMIPVQPYRDQFFYPKWQPMDNQQNGFQQPGRPEQYYDGRSDSGDEKTSVVSSNSPIKDTNEQDLEINEDKEQNENNEDIIEQYITNPTSPDITVTTSTSIFPLDATQNSALEVNSTDSFEDFNEILKNIDDFISTANADASSTTKNEKAKNSAEPDSSKKEKRNQFRKQRDSRKPVRVTQSHEKQNAMKLRTRNCDKPEIRDKKCNESKIMENPRKANHKYPLDVIGTTATNFLMNTSRVKKAADKH